MPILMHNKMRVVAKQGKVLRNGERWGDGMRDIFLFLNK